jgi:hypothetical protein
VSEVIDSLDEYIGDLALFEMATYSLTSGDGQRTDTPADMTVAIR